LIPVGGAAPPFDLPASSGGRLGTEALAGRFAVIVFYPKNNTPG